MLPTVLIYMYLIFSVARAQVLVASGDQAPLLQYLKIEKKLHVKNFHFYS